MTNYFVDRGADGFGEAFVVERRGDGVLNVNDVIVTDTVKLTR